MHVRFWGTRGSIAAPGPTTARYGGNTSCVEVRSSDDTRIVLDCGTGARELGLALARSAPRGLRLHLFIGHTHWDHIQGFPFFVPAFLPGAELNIYAPLGFQRSLEEAMAGQMEYSYFPVKLRDLRSRIHFTELDEGFFRVGDVLVETQYLNHTAPTIAYRISSDGATVAYATDHEPFLASAEGGSQHPGDEQHVAFLRNADLVIHDAQYTEEEYRSKIGWGHSSIEYATDVALAAGAKRLALFHHDPGHDDATLERLEAGAQARAAARGGGIEVFAAAEGLEIAVRGNGEATAVRGASALQHRPIAGRRVIVVSANQDEIAAIEEVLDDDGLMLVRMPDIRAALARGPIASPDLAIVDAQLPDGAGVSLLAPLRARLHRKNFPIIVLADGSLAPSAVYGGESSATDYMPKPISPPMLRARVRAWLARTATAARPESIAVAGEAPVPDSRDIPTERTPLAADYANLLGSVPLFRTLPLEQRLRLVERAIEQHYQAGHAIVHQGEWPDRLFVILSGKVRVIEAASDTQTEWMLGELVEGELFGELALLTDRPRSATVVAVEPTRCLLLPQSDFMHVLHAAPGLGIGLVRMLAARLYDADRKLARYAPDPVTGLASRRAFHDQYPRVAAAARRRKSGILLLMLDVVQLKTINDRYGYSLGDDVLRAVADALMESTRTTDLAARYGVDEFAVLLPEARPKDVEVVVNRVREKLAELSTRRGLPRVVYCSVGVAHRVAPPDTPDELFRDADHDMQRTRARQRSG